jgi:hypothetical protein
MWTLFAGLVAYLGFSCVVGVVLVEGALHLARHPVAAKATFAPLVSEWSRHGFDDITVHGADGAVLRGWIVRPVRGNGSAVILLHGVGDNRDGMVSFAPMFLERGYAVLIPDSRAHGESGGSLVTYGWLETDDVRRWASELRKITRGISDPPSSHCVYLLGESMGAAIAVQTAAVPEICGVVAEAPFSSFREIGYERIAQALGVGARWTHFAAWSTLESSFLCAKLRYGIDFNQVSPERILASPHAPVLLIAGLRDRNIPSRHSSQILVSAVQPTALWLVPNADHTNASQVQPEEFRRRVLLWFEKYAAAPREATASVPNTSIH